MPIKLSRYFGIEAAALDKQGVFDAFLGIDNKLFVDPNLLKAKLDIPEFSAARQSLTAYFSQVIKLLKASKSQGDIAWQEAEKRLTFKEENGTALGYGGVGSHGRAVGRSLARILVTRAKQIIDLGIEDPEMFELIGLFQEDIGSDLLSDMAVSILSSTFLEYTQRVSTELDLHPRESFAVTGQQWTLPVNPSGKRPLIFVPAQLLSKLPVALDRSEISEVAAFNSEVRKAWNAIVAAAREDDRSVTKEQIRDLLFARPKNLTDLISVYREAATLGYDFESDPEGLFSWDFIGRSAATANPLDIRLGQPRTVEELRAILNLIVSKFKKLVEENRLYEFLYKEDGRPKHEVFAQRLFYAVADTYCEANNLDLNREPNAGNGPVDFKLSTGYKGRVLVEVKKSSNSHLIDGFEQQLPEYEKSESTDESMYLIVRVSDSDSSIKSVLSLRDRKVKEGKKVPQIVVVDGRKKESASHTRKQRDR
jgi:hypothetical protein